MQVHEVMTEKVISASPDTTVQEVARLLRAHDIGCVPIVDGEGAVIGIVGEADLVPKEMPLPFSRVTVPTLFKKVISRGELDLEELYKDMKDVTVDELMQEDVITVDADDDVGQAAWLLAHHHLKRLPVLRDGKLAGIISRTDLIKILAEGQD